MATLESPLGRINQSFGGMTASKWKNKTVLKQKVPARNTSNTPAQANQRARFKAAAQLAGSLGPALRMGFRSDAATMTEQNVFQTKNNEAITAVGGVPNVAWNALVVSAGTVGAVIALNVTYVSNTGAMNATFTDNSNGASALPTDLIQIIVVDKVSGESYWVTDSGERSTGQGGGTIGAGLTAANLVAYAFFKRADSTATGPSSYDQVS